MHKTYIRNIFFTLTFLITLTSAITFSSGPGGGYSNAPGESNCATSTCHDDGSVITSGNANLNKILFNPNFTSGGYMPNVTYTMELTFKQSGISKFGFQVTCLNSSTNLAEGTFTASNSRVQKSSFYSSGKYRYYLEHTTAGNSAVAGDSTRWVLTWKAPASDVGKVKFYVTINAANNDNDDTGDKIYAKVFEYACGLSLPAANATSNDSVTCTNYKAAMKGSATNSPTSYLWKFTGANPTGSSLQNPTVTFTVPGKQYAILTASNASGTGRPDTLIVQVNPSPGATIQNGTSGTICGGDSLLLTANSGLNYTYKWNPTGKITKTTYIKDSGIYTVTTKSPNGCSATSANFKLSHYKRPTISITRNSVKDSFCGTYTDILTASGTDIDSVLWCVNGKVIARTNNLTYNLALNQSGMIYALAKNTLKCLSVPSNSFPIVVFNKITPLNFNSSKTTSDVHLNWSKPAGADSIRYSVNGGTFGKPATDSSLILNSLAPNTLYNINIRTYQKTLCKFADTVISVKTNSCSNLSYFVFSDARVCKGSDLKCTVKNLYKAKYSVSFNNSPYTSDTVLVFKPQKSDSITILIKDSLSPTCAPLKERVGYTVDTLPKEVGYGPIILSCDSQYLYKFSPQYQTYEFYKNNILAYSGANNTFLFTKLVTGDKLMGKAVVNACSRLYTSTFNINTAYSSAFTYNRVWKNYTFKANDSLSAVYNWYINSVAAGNTNPLVLDMSQYKGTTVSVSLDASDLTGCSDIKTQQITVPDFSGIQAIQTNHVRIYPNPFTEMLVIETDLDDYELEMTDITGKLVTTEMQQNAINTTALSKGSYFVRLKKDGKVVYQGKFVKY